MKRPPISRLPVPLARLQDWGRRVAASVFGGTSEAKADREADWRFDELEMLLDESRAQRGGEISARQRAHRIVAIYREAIAPQRARMLGMITGAFTPDRERLDAALAAMRAATSESERSHAEALVRIALDAPRAKFLTQFNLLPEGVKFLVDLRADLLGFLEREPSLEVLRVELDDLLESWFDPGFLELRRITWQSPALVLEKLIAYEAVHRIESWEDMRNRLDRDRRCYAFFHPRMPNEPLIFVEIALSKGLPESVQLLLDQAAPVQDPRSADTAVFYSISNAQKGLRGISLGNLLLKRVIEDLQGDLPWLRTFATLSPLPGFRKWLERVLSAGDALPAESARKLAETLGHPDPARVLSDSLARKDWQDDEPLAASLREPMERLCARYLLKEKSGTHPVDPVAQFHLNNGARVNRIFWLADASARGMAQSCGMMVSYRYDVSEVDRNHEEFLKSGHIAASRRVRRLVD